MRLHVAALSVLVYALSLTQAFGLTQRALLIGINTYQPQGTQAVHPAGCGDGRCSLDRFEDLHGAVNDAQAMADLLTSPKFSFPPRQVVLLTNPAPPRPRPGVQLLPASETTRDGILEVMRKYLVDLPNPGDTVVFYIASHGSLRVNSKGNKLTLLVDGKYVPTDSTIVASDAWRGGYDIRDREMTRIFNAALDKGIRLTAILDSCHSGGLSRGIGSGYRARTLSYDSRDIAEAPDLLPNGETQPAPAARKDNPALIFAAAQQDQSAYEASDTGSEPHGAFTAALIQALEVLPATASASVVNRRVRAVLGGSSIPVQEPDLDAGAMRSRQPLFGDAVAASTMTHAAALMTGEDGNVWLDIGLVSGIGAGSEFASIAPTGSQPPVTLRIVGLKGIARSTAEVVSPPGATVANGEIFVMTKWVPADAAPLLVWHWPTNLSLTQIDDAVVQVHVSGVVVVDDPAEAPWTHELSWDGTQWQLQQAGVSPPIFLGPRLTGSALRQYLPTGSKLWVNLPPPSELRSKLQVEERNSAIQNSPEMAGAQYVLAGALRGNQPAYSWLHKSDLEASPHKAATADHTPGCSTISPYPVRSDWVELDGAKSLDGAVGTLNRYAARLAKVHGWLQMADSPAEASSADYYTLEMIPAEGGAPVVSGGVVHQRDRVKMALKSGEIPINEQRWVYIFDIDCQGRGALLYPLDHSENQFPNRADQGEEFILPHSGTVRIVPPFGLETYVLLSTAEPLSDPSALNFDGVAARGARVPESPLEKLLHDTSSGLRGSPGPMPTNWGVSYLTLRSLPLDAVSEESSGVKAQPHP
jgi:hypothetical protein